MPADPLKCVADDKTQTDNSSICRWIMGGISHEGKSAGATESQDNLVLLPPPGFLWYGQCLAQPVEDLAHVAT